MGNVIDINRNNKTVTQKLEEMFEILEELMYVEPK